MARKGLGSLGKAGRGVKDVCINNKGQETTYMKRKMHKYI
jgi:hypothetical protein